MLMSVGNLLHNNLTLIGNTQEIETGQNDDEIFVTLRKQFKIFLLELVRVS